MKLFAFNGRFIYSATILEWMIDNAAQHAVSTKVMPVKCFEKCLADKVWRDTVRARAISPADVLGDMGNPKFHKHLTKIAYSSQNPILIMKAEGPPSGPKIIDGYHRLAKAKLDGAESITVRVVPEQLVAMSVVEINTVEGFEKADKLTRRDLWRLYSERRRSINDIIDRLPACE